MKSDQPVSVIEIFAGLSSYLKFPECASMIRNSLHQKHIIVLIKEKITKMFDTFKTL